MDATTPPDVPTRSPRARRVALLRGALAWAVGAALLAWLASGVPLRELARAVTPPPAGLVAATIAGLLGSYLLRALRMRAELGKRHAVALRDVLPVMLLHNAAVNVLPLRGGEAAYPLLVHRRLGVPLGQAVASLVWMRVQDLLLLALLALALWPGLPLPLRLAGAALAAGGTALGLRLLDRLAAPGRAPPRGRISCGIRGAAEALALAPRHGVAGWVFAAGNWTVKLAALGALLAALAGLEPAAALRGALGGELAGVLPVQGPAGLGTYEAGVWAGAALRGDAGRALAAPALLVHLLGLATAIASGAAAWTLARPGRGAARRGAPGVPPAGPEAARG
jgi:hypothetical protein